MYVPIWTNKEERLEGDYMYTCGRNEKGKRKEKGRELISVRKNKRGDTYVHTYVHRYVHTYVHRYVHTYVHHRCVDGRIEICKGLKGNYMYTSERNEKGKRKEKGRKGKSVR
jgi:hypothetical protein